MQRGPQVSPLVAERVNPGGPRSGDGRRATHGFSARGFSRLAAVRRERLAAVPREHIYENSTDAIRLQVWRLVSVCVHLFKVSAILSAILSRGRTERIPRFFVHQERLHIWFGRCPDGRFEHDELN